MFFTSIASTCHARVSIHAATCSRNTLDKTARRKAGLSNPSPIANATTWQEARASLLAELAAEGRDDITITICKCAKIA